MTIRCGVTILVRWYNWSIAKSFGLEYWLGSPIDSVLSFYWTISLGVVYSWSGGRVSHTSQWSSRYIDLDWEHDQRMILFSKNVLNLLWCIEIYSTDLAPCKGTSATAVNEGKLCHSWSSVWAITWTPTPWYPLCSRLESHKELTTCSNLTWASRSRTWEWYNTVIYSASRVNRPKPGKVVFVRRRVQLIIIALQSLLSDSEITSRSCGTWNYSFSIHRICVISNISRRKKGPNFRDI